MFTLCNCRSDEYYNEKYLPEEDSQKILGYDLCVEKGIYNFFNNVDRFQSELSAVGINCDDVDFEFLQHNPDEITDDMLSEINDSTKQMLALRNVMFQWAELQRNSIIVGCIDNDKDVEFHKKGADEGTYTNAIIRQRQQIEDIQYII